MAIPGSELTLTDWRTVSFITTAGFAGCAIWLLVQWRKYGWMAKTERFDLDRQQIVEMIAQNQDLKSILHRIVNSLEEQEPSFGVAVLLLRDARLAPEAHGRVHEEILQELGGTIEAEPEAAPCFVRSPEWRSLVSEPRWPALKTTALRHGVRGFWSFPLYSGADEMLGVLSVLTPDSRQPSAKQGRLVEMSSRLAAIAIEQRNVVDELNYRAQHDPLTKLYNRVMLEERLQESIQSAGWQRGSVRLLYLDLDRFKLVNNFLGHRAGDVVLQQVAARLSSCIEPGGVLARVGGDEFIAILPSENPLPDPSPSAQALLESLKAPFVIGEHEIHLSASIGISICPSHATDSAALERNAYSALHEAKRSGRNQYCVFQLSSDRCAPERLEIERHLRFALRNRELHLVYQPQVDARDLQVVGAESLLRWRHSQLGSVSPSVFIPIAEDAGFIASIGAWALQQASLQRQAWLRAGGPEVRISVNVSAAQFDRSDFLDVVTGTLDSTGIDPRTLVLELTESAVMQNLDRSIEYMNFLCRQGIEFSLDDFGTGHSSLAQLQRLPIHELKIDRSFVQEIRSADERPALVESIIGLAHRLGMRTVAEGVEDREQLGALRAMGCDIVQGFLFARPLSPEAFHDLSPRFEMEEFTLPISTVLSEASLSRI